MKYTISIILLFLFSLSSLFAQEQASKRKVKINSSLELLKLSENAYVHISYDRLSDKGLYSSNGLIFINGDEAFLFDMPTNDSITKLLVDYITESFKVKIVGFAPNHWHKDCMGSLSYLKEKKIRSYASIKSMEMAKEKELPLPKIWFVDSLNIEVGDKIVQLYYLGGAYTNDNIVAWIPSEHILFGGCMVRPINAEGKGKITDANLIAWSMTIDKIINKFSEARIVIPEHGAIGSIDLLYFTKELLLK